MTGIRWFSKRKRWSSNDHLKTGRQDWTKAKSFLCTKPGRKDRHEMSEGFEKFLKDVKWVRAVAANFYSLCHEQGSEKSKQQEYKKQNTQTRHYNPIYCVDWVTLLIVPLQEGACTTLPVPKIRTLSALFEGGDLLTGPLVTCHRTIGSVGKQAKQQKKKTEVRERKSRTCWGSSCWISQNTCWHVFLCCHVVIRTPIRKTDKEIININVCRTHITISPWNIIAVAEN